MSMHVPGDYATIQEAIDAAQPNDEILVDPGEYAGAIITKPVHIKGAGEGTVINEGAYFGYSGFYMRKLRYGDADGTVIENLVIEADVEADFWQGITGWDTHNVTVRKVKIRGALFGIVAASASNWTIEDNVIENGLLEGIDLFALERPLFAQSPSGGDHRVLNNTVHMGVYPWSEYFPDVAVSGISLGTEGLGPNESLTGIMIQGNEVTSTPGQVTYGVSLEDGGYDGDEQLRIEGNKIVGSNELADTDYGVHYFPSELASHNIVAQNISANVHYGQGVRPAPPDHAR